MLSKGDGMLGLAYQNETRTVLKTVSLNRLNTNLLKRPYFIIKINLYEF